MSVLLPIVFAFDGVRVGSGDVGAGVGVGLGGERRGRWWGVLGWSGECEW